MQFLVDFFPLLMFLGTYLAYEDIFLALKVLMVAMPIAFIIKWRLTREIDKMLLGSTLLLLVMGGATLIFRNPMFLYWKPTAFYWVAALVFLGSQFLGEKPMVHRLFASIGRMPQAKWHQLNIAWVIFFVLSGFLNLYVAFNFDEAFWVKFKVLGFTGITFVFIVVQMVWLMRHLEQVDSPDEETK